MKPSDRYAGSLLVACGLWLIALLAQQPAAQGVQGAADAPIHPDTAFQTSHDCLACHNTLTAPSGEDVSIGSSWRGSMMANSARDPYWLASVRREAIDHPQAASEIEHECSICHMPMANAAARASGGHGEIFDVLEDGRDSAMGRLAADGVSCALCHQIGPERLGTPESFTGGFVLTPGTDGRPRMFGPYEIDAGRTAIMRSATDASPASAPHIRQSEVCATCHTLFTNALDPSGAVVGTLPEQVPYLEWRHSAFAGEERSCQSCHMPAVEGPTPIASVLGEPREGMGRHTFLGGNFFMLRLFNRYRRELGVEALPLELEASARGTERQLQTITATLAVTRAVTSGGQLLVNVAASNLTGHKLPTGYPSRRAWLHLTVRDGDERVVFESGAVDSTGLIRGNDNDADPARFEPHHAEIRRGDDVQVYEAVMVDPGDRVTTGLLQATRFIKDNRLLPRGFDKATASPDVAVHGDALTDADFGAAGDVTRYVVDVGGARGPFTVDVELRFQPIAFRWARNLARYDAPEPARFVTFYDAVAPSSSIVLARASAVAR